MNSDIPTTCLYTYARVCLSLDVLFRYRSIPCTHATQVRVRKGVAFVYSMVEDGGGYSKRQNVEFT